MKVKIAKNKKNTLRRTASARKNRSSRTRKQRKVMRHKLDGGGSRCAHMSEDSNYRIMGKLVCAWLNGEIELYRSVVLNTISNDPTNFIRYVYDNYKTFKPINKKALGQAFITFQEEAIKTYNLEHILSGLVGDEDLMPKDW